MRTFIRESAGVPMGPSVYPSQSGSEAEPSAPLTQAEVSAIEALTRLTVGLGVLVIVLATALTVLAIFR